jgi:hypothetical protein
MEIVIPRNPIIASQSRLRIKERAVPSRKVSPRNAGNPFKEKIDLFREPDILIEFLISSSSSAPHQCSDSQNRVIGLHLLHADYSRNRLPNP